jgi:radical SAM superfamily enzyme YgiQ (UPF0313 family)
MWELQQAGIDPVTPEQADIVLITVSSQQGLGRVKSEHRKVKRTNPNAKIVIGGGGCYGPAVFDPYADMICVGEGPNFIRTLLRSGYDAAAQTPEAWIPGQTRVVIPAQGFPWELPPLNHPDGTVRLFGSRGCKFNCLFCQTGWENTYRPNPDPFRLSSQIDAMQQAGRRLAIVTNDAAEEHVQLRGQQEFISVTLHNTMKNLLPLTREQTKGVRFGVEGVSERLRKAVGKPIPSDDLLATSIELLKNGVGVRWFFIPGLPGETDADWDELRRCVIEIKRHVAKGVVMMNFHAFIPQPATPLCVLPLVDEYWERYDEFRRWFFHGMGFTRRVQLVNPARYAGRLERAKESMAATEEELRRGWFEYDNPNWRIQYNKTPDEMRRIAAIYAKRVGVLSSNGGIVDNAA